MYDPRDEDALTSAAFLPRSRSTEGEPFWGAIRADTDGAGRLDWRPMTGQRSTWTDFRIRLATFVVATVGIAAIFLFHRIVASRAQGLGRSLRIGELFWVAGFIVSAVRLRSFRCPGCGRYFFISGFRTNFFTRSCMNCGLPKWQDSSRPDDPFTSW